MTPIFDLYHQKNLIGRFLLLVGAAILALGPFGSIILISDSYTTEMGWMCLFGSMAAGAHLIGKSEIIRLMSQETDDELTVE